MQLDLQRVTRMADQAEMAQGAGTAWFLRYPPLRSVFRGCRVTRIFLFHRGQRPGLSRTSYSPSAGITSR